MGAASTAVPFTPATLRMLCFFRECFPTHRVDVDVLFSQELSRRGHQIDFVMQACRDCASAGPRDWRGRTVWVGPTDSGPGFWHRLHRQLLGVWHDLKCLRLIGSGGYDSVQVMDKFVTGYFALRAARRRGLKFYFWLSFPYPEAGRILARSGAARYPLLGRARGFAIGWLLYRRILPRCDHLFVQSEQMKREIAARGIPLSKITSVPMGVSIARFGAVKTRPEGAQPAQACLAYVGTLGAERHLEVLVDMLAILRGRGADVRLLLIGDADLAEHRVALEERAAQLRVSPFMQITGLLPHAQAMERLRSADLGLSPIFPSELFRMASPTKLIEYMALGLPVVANDHPDQRRVLHESHAGLCVPWHARHFARAVGWILRRDPEQRRQMGLRGRRWVENNRDYTRIADDLELTYRRLQPQAPDNAARRGDIEHSPE